MTQGQGNSKSCWYGNYRFGRSLIDCLNNIEELGRCRIRFIATTQNLDTDEKNPASKFLLHVLGAAAEFERSLIRERTLAGQMRYRSDYAAGKVGKTVYSRSGKNLPPHRPRKIFNRDTVATQRAQGLSIRAIATRLELGGGPWLGRYRSVPKLCSSCVETELPEAELSDIPFQANERMSARPTQPGDLPRISVSIMQMSADGSVVLKQNRSG
jgi:hypothetical protein